MSRRLRLLLVFAVLALLAAGCGARNNNPYTAKGSAACFTKKGFTGVSTATGKVGFIAAFAANGGLIATTTDGNKLTIAFTEDESTVASTKLAFKSHAPKRLQPRINDIMETQRNAVLVWTVSPTPDQLTAAIGCLHP